MFVIRVHVLIVEGSMCQLLVSRRSDAPEEMTMKVRLITKPIHALEGHTSRSDTADVALPNRSEWRAFARFSSALSIAVLGMAGCAAGAELDDLDLAPESFEAAEATLARIDAMLEADPEDPLAWDALATLRPRLDELNHLVARIDVGPNHTVSFFEVEPGVLGVSESAPEGAALVLTDELAVGLSVTELYATLAHEPAPTSLVDAEARELAAAIPAENESELLVLESAGPLDTSSELGASELGSTQLALTGAQGQYFRDTYCFDAGDLRGCYPNHWGARFAEASAKTSFFTVAPYSGNVSVRFRYSGETQFIDAVFSGEVRNWWWHSASYRTNGYLPYSPRDYRRRTHRWDILDASGDQFHWAFNFRWNCSYQTCDAWLR
jgi:hypothetical protein